MRTDIRWQIFFSTYSRYVSTFGFFLRYSIPYGIMVSWMGLGMFPNQLIITKAIRFVSSTTKQIHWRKKRRRRRRNSSRKAEMTERICCAIILAAIYHDTTKTCEFEYTSSYIGMALVRFENISTAAIEHTIEWHNKMERI